jgi:hypothetical protein
MLPDTVMPVTGDVIIPVPEVISVTVPTTGDPTCVTETEPFIGLIVNPVLKLKGPPWGV